MSINFPDKFGLARFFSGLLCFFATTLFCASPQASRTMDATQTGRPFNMRVDVELVTAEVTVLDKKGNPVPNLKKEDFRLYEDGKQQEIISFDEVTTESTRGAFAATDQDDGGPGRGKVVLILFDDSSIPPGHLKAARDSATRFVNEHMRPQDLFAVASFNLSLKILQNFTREREKILQAIALPAVSGASTARPDPSPDQMPVSGGRQFPDMRAVDARMAATGTGFQVENLLRSLDSLNISVEHLKGQKSVLAYTESTSFNTGTVQTIYSRTLNSAKRSKVVFYTVDPGGLGSNPIGEIKSPTKDENRGLFTSRISARGMMNTMFQQGGGQTGGTTGGGSGGSSSGGSSGGSTGGGTGSAGGTPGSSMGNSSTNGNSASPGNRSFLGLTNSDGSSWGTGQQSSQQSLLKSLAADTGGWAIYNTNDYDTELDKLDQQLSNYYILGFQSNNPKHDGEFRKVEVKTDIKGVALKYRKNYLDRQPVDTLASSKQEKTLLGAMASPEMATQIPIIFRASYFYDSPHRARVLISTKIRMTKVALKKKGGELGCDLSVMGVAYAEDGSTSARFSEILHIAVDKEREQDFRRSRVSYRNYFRLRPGKYRLKLAASDERNNLGSAEQLLEVPAFPESGMACSSLVLAEEVSRLPDLIRDLQSRLLDESAPLIFAGMEILPSVENKLRLGAPLPVFFKIYRLPKAASPGKLMANAKLLSDKGKELLLSAIPLEANISRSGDAATVGLNLPFKDVSAGKYTLLLETSDGESPQPLTVRTDLEFVAE
jgi:VWFA-related protein